jgi:hypothetical protein
MGKCVTEWIGNECEGNVTIPANDLALLLYLIRSASMGDMVDLQPDGIFIVYENMLRTR